MESDGSVKVEAKTAHTVIAGCPSDKPLQLETEEERVERANREKAKGNEYYVEGRYQEAITCYTIAINLTSGLVSKEETDDQDQDEHFKNKQKEHKNALGIFFSNRAACHLHLKAYKEVVDDATTALGYAPNYVKALLRRAQAQEGLGKLTEAFEDYTAVVALDRTVEVAVEATHRLPPLIKMQQEKEQAEMLAQLKDVGNKFLGLFGLSTDNFMVRQDPSTGSYSINIQQNGGPHNGDNSNNNQPSQQQQQQ